MTGAGPCLPAAARRRLPYLGLLLSDGEFGEVVLPGVVVLVVPVVLEPSGVVVVPMEPLAPGVPVVLVEPVALVLLWSVPTVPVVVLPVVESEVVAEPLAPLCGDAVPCAPAEVPAEPLLWPSAARATTSAPVAKSAANFSFKVIDGLHDRGGDTIKWCPPHAEPQPTDAAVRCEPGLSCSRG